MPDETAPTAAPASAPDHPPLAPQQLYRKADLDGLAFTTTAELAPLARLSNQPRAHEAIDFGTGIDRRGFNIFVVSSSGARAQQAVKALLDEAASTRKPPQDWIYVNNFATPHRPVALALPAGRAPVFQKAVHDLIDDLRLSLPALFESEDYQKRRRAIEQEVQAKNERAFNALNEKAAARSIAILRTPMGFGMAPVHDGKVVPPDQFNAWPEAQQQATREAIGELEKELEETLRVLPRREKEQRDAVRALDRDTAGQAADQLFAQLRSQFADLPALLTHIDAIRTDLLENLPLLISAEAAEPGAMQAAMRMSGPFGRYEVNVVVTQGEHSPGAPVVEEPHPTLANLVGRIEYAQIQGALVTDFRLIKAGALHRANGGTLLLDVRNLLTEPFSWPALKRALRRREITIEDAGRFMGLNMTVSLEPDPIPLELKVVLFGNRMLYHLLTTLDPDFGQDFKVLADFDDDADRSPPNEAMLAHVIADLAAREKLLPLDRGGVARVVEHASRLADDANKLSLQVEGLHDLLAEAGHIAASAGREVIGRDDVEAAIAQRIRRLSRLRERSQEMVLRDIALIETSGARVGQINGLAVMSFADYAFGHPSRISCRVRPGGGKIVDIEREVELGGKLHSKGVLILSGFLAGRYALDTPMSLYASLVFEQSYGGVDGDSASSAELYALLSAISGFALRQDFAVTGSVNQLGTVQAIGGVNEKIEGFFDICAARGLSGTQGVLIPASNVQHLMLRPDIVAACAAGRFAIHAVSSIDEGIALLTGRQAGERGADGLYPEGSVNRAVEDRLLHFAALRKEAAGKDGSETKTS
ncbi:MAG: AAA family ATPase [Rhodospirillales bacterium]|nr:AAA family ATPase [Rhodospirillales bacterium]